MDRVLKLRAVQYMGGGCILCGYSKCLRALHFHHTNSFEKEFDISEKSSWNDIKEELRKCILLCSNCHAECHSGLVDLEVLIELAER